MSDEAWWVAARLYQDSNALVRPVAEGPLAELIWIALEMPDAEQQKTIIKASSLSSAAVLPYDAWKAMSEQIDFPTCI